MYSLGNERQTTPIEVFSSFHVRLNYKDMSIINKLFLIKEVLLIQKYLLTCILSLLKKYIVNHWIKKI